MKKDELPESTTNTLKDQMSKMEDPNHRIRDLVQRRIVDFSFAELCHVILGNYIKINVIQMPAYHVGLPYYIQHKNPWYVAFVDILYDC